MAKPGQSDMALISQIVVKKSCSLKTLYLISFNCHMAICIFKVIYRNLLQAL